MISSNLFLYIIGVCLAYICVFSYSVRKYKHISTKTLILLSLGSYVTIFLLLIYSIAKNITKDDKDFFDLFN